MTDDLVTKVKMALESDPTPRVFHIRSVDALALVSCIEALTAERDRLREALRDGRRLLAIAQADRIRLLIQLEQCEKRHE